MANRDSDGRKQKQSHDIEQGNQRLPESKNDHVVQVMAALPPSMYGIRG